MGDVARIERGVVVSVVVEKKRCGRMGGARGLEPIDLDNGTEEVHEIVVRIGLVEDVPLVDEAAGGRDNLRDMRERAGGDFALAGGAAEASDRVGEITPAGPDEDVATHVEAVVLQPREAGDRLRFGEAAAPLTVPRRPLQIVFGAGGVEQFEGFLPVGAVVGAVVDEPGHLERGAKVKRRFCLCDAGRCAGHGASLGIDDDNGEIAFAQRFDAGKGGGAPRGAGFTAGISGPREREAAERNALAVENEIEAAEFDALAFEAESEYDFWRRAPRSRPRR